MSVDKLKANPSPIQGCDDASAIGLYSDDHENVCVETWEAGSHQTIKDHKVIEVFVISGSFSENEQQFEQEYWLQPPAKANFEAHVVVEGARAWIKTEHLGEYPEPAPI